MLLTKIKKHVEQIIKSAIKSITFNIKMNRSLIILILAAFMSSQGCSLLDNESFTPAYLVVEEVDLAVNSAQGYPSHNITDLWVTVDNVNLGVYTLPAKIPIITSGNPMNIKINAGVKPNGSKSESVFYPFFDPIIIEENLEPGQELEQSLVFKYTDDAKFDIIDGFEGSTQLNKDLDENLNTSIQKSDIDNNGGGFCGLIELDGDNRSFRVTTNSFFKSENNAGGATWLEFDFKTTINLGVGYRIEQLNEVRSEITVVVVPNDEWTRVYVEMSPFVVDPDVLGYQIQFEAQHTGSGTSQILLDNVKLVHF